MVWNGGDKNPTLKLSVENINYIEGYINIGIFDRKDVFLKKGKALKSYSIKVTKHTETIVINNLPKGIYAISLYHDKNSDGICNLNILGIPKEQYAFSNNFKPRFAAPDFDDCSFELSKDLHLKIRLLK
ncbi:MAG: DUF2141 domain-containing protein [Ferruginibacter sp.]